MNRLEGLAAIKVDTDDWQSKGLITESLKKKRHELEKYYQDDFKKMYQKLE